MGSACTTCYGDVKEKSDKDEFSTSDLKVFINKKYPKHFYSKKLIFIN